MAIKTNKNPFHTELIKQGYSVIEIVDYIIFKDKDIIAFGLNKESPLIGIFKKHRGRDCTHSDYVVLGTHGDLYFEQDGWIYENARFATETEIQNLINALKQSSDPRAKKYYENFFKRKYLFKPFDKVLVRKNSEKFWKARFFDYEFQSNYFCTDGEYYENCIPYNAQTSYLHNTKEDYQNS